MRPLDILSLTSFANSIVARGRAEADLDCVGAPLVFPVGTDADSLHRALVAQAEQAAKFRATVSAEIDTLITTNERLEVESRIRDGELSRVKDDYAAVLVELARLRADMTEIGDTLVGRLIAEFDKRMNNQP